MVTVPFIRLCGRWLETAGFSIGAKLVVETREGRLIITSKDPVVCENEAQRKPF